jgi:DNA-directed RNA polymerase subunit beta'
MAVHVPLSRAAVKEARDMMLSHHNILLPSSGEPTVAPTLDMVLGCYYLTTIRHEKKEDGRLYGSFEEAKLAYEFGVVDLREEIEVRNKETGEIFKTSVGRILFNEVLPEELGYYNKIIDKSTLKQIATKCCNLLPDEETGKVLDSIKRLGFHYASRSGITIAMNDIEVPANKPQMLAEAEARIATIEDQYHRGLITDEERYNGVIGAWMETTDNITNTISNNLDRYGGIYMMATSGAKGNISQIRQMAGMRGLMTDPSGKIIEFPIKSSLREGHSVLEYFISTHGARKGLADTALRTSDSGYLTRRLIDVAQDVITAQHDCGTTEGSWISEPKEKGLLPSLAERILGRMAASDIVHPETGEIIVAQNEEIDEKKIEEISAAGLTSVHVRSPLTCQSRRGTCRLCYGRDLARGELIEHDVAVGIIAAESIGEPGTQLTLRTFHTGGVVGLDITSGLPRVEELFEARTPRGQAIISEIDGVAEVIQDEDGRKIKITSTEIYQDEYALPTGWQVMVKKGQWVDIGTVLAAPAEKAEKAGDSETTPAEEVQPIVARFAGEANVKKKQLVISYAEKEEREYVIPSTASIWIKTDDEVKAGQQLTDGSINPHDILRILGKEAVQQYLVDEVQKVYRSQGVTINDKHIEVIAHQMLTKVRIDSAGDTDLVPDELVDKFTYEDTNAKVLAEGGEPATAHTVLLGITRASLSTDSWLAAASFQETTRILTEAAANGRIDRLVGLKENVIIGKLIPARYLGEEEVAELASVEEEDEAMKLLASLGMTEEDGVLTVDEAITGEGGEEASAETEDEEGEADTPDADVTETEEPTDLLESEEATAETPESETIAEEKAADLPEGEEEAAEEPEADATGEEDGE